MQQEKYETRKARSLDMLKSGVEPIKNGFNEYFILSQVEKNVKYKVTIKNCWYSCECPDNKDGNLCKHILFLKTYFALKFKVQEYKHKVSTSIPCPQCNSTQIQKFGTRKTIMGLKQRLKCNDCGKRFVNSPVSKIKGNTECVITAIDLYMKGVSYRGMSRQHEAIIWFKSNPRYNNKLG